MKHRILIDLGEYIDDIAASQRHELAAFFNDEEGKERIVNVLDDNMFKSYFDYFFYNYSMLSVKDLTTEEVVEACTSVNTSAVGEVDDSLIVGLLCAKTQSRGDAPTALQLGVQRCCVGLRSASCK